MTTMAMSKRTELAAAKRKLRRIEEDEPAFRIRIAGLTEESQRKFLDWFHGILESERKHVQKLEEELETD